jgi:hypothetical protein
MNIFFEAVFLKPLQPILSSPNDQSPCKINISRNYFSLICILDYFVVISRSQKIHGRVSAPPPLIVTTDPIP